MMRELTAFEIENVSGAGWLQDGLAALGSKVGAAAWTMGTDALSINLPLLGTLNLADLAPDLGKTLGESIGSSIGGTIESALAGLPVIGGLLNKLLGNQFPPSQHEKRRLFQAPFRIITSGLHLLRLIYAPNPVNAYSGRNRCPDSGPSHPDCSGSSSHRHAGYG